jgi:3-deoxy-D-manno-octulosonic-acid transferase
LGVLFYNLILILTLPLSLPVLAIWMILRADSRTGFSERLGHWPGAWDGRRAETRRIWIHAASVGESLAAMPLLERWLRERPSWEIVVSVMTPAGRRLVEQRLGSRVRVFFFPIDFPGIPGRLMGRVDPDLILLVETELWPNFICAASRRRIPVLLLNGRISPRSYPRYRAIGWFFRGTLRTIQGFCMQSSEDAGRIVTMGAPPERVRVLGNLKFDQAVTPLTDRDRRSLLEQTGWDPSAKILVAGSTHEKEEEMLLSVFEAVKKQVPDLRMVLAPRHLNRMPGVGRLLEGRRFTYRRYSELGADPPEKEVEILLVDTIGRLGQLYGLGMVVFVGGSLVPVGGHNLLEPAALGRPVLFGPYVQHVSEFADLLSASGGGQRVRDPEELGQVLVALLADGDRSRSMGEAARDAVRRHQGAARRVSQRVEQELESISLKKIPRLDFRPTMERWFMEMLSPSCAGIPAVFAGAVLRALSVLYRGGQDIRAAAYAHGLLRSFRLDRPVISVGNLTLGGSGKTPAVLAICRFLLQRNLRPVVLTRGYGGRSTGALQVLAGDNGGKANPGETGDEPRMISDRLPEVPVIVSPDRVAAGRYALDRFRPDVLVLDDGYQYLRLRRDLNLLVLDSVRPFGNGFVFPRGSLREAVRHMARADAVLLTHVADPAETEELRRFLRRYRPELPVFTSRHTVAHLVHMATGRVLSVGGMGPERIIAVAGIGQPERFFKLLQDGRMTIAAACEYSDHYRYAEDDLQMLEAEARRRNAAMIVTTEKDAVRIKSLRGSLDLWWSARLELEIDHGPDFESVLGGAVR